MYFFVKTTTLNSKRKEFMAGGMVYEGFNPSVDHVRSVSTEYSDALKFATIDDSEVMMARNFTLCTLVDNQVLPV